MRRLAVIVLAGLLAGLSSRAPLLHIHEFAERNHPDHHHGPASHDHHQTSVSVGPSAAAVLEEADPAGTAVSVSFVGPVPAQVHLVADLGGCAAAADPASGAEISRKPQDLRVHEPPGRHTRFASRPAVFSRLI